MTFLRMRTVLFWSPILQRQLRRYSIKLPLKILIVKNHFLGLVREYQEKTYHSHYKAVELSDFPKQEGIARAYDMEYFECSDNDSLSDELDRFLACPKASLMVCYVDSKNNTK